MLQIPPTPRRGATLAELLVALLLLELAGVMALAAAFTADRLGHRAGLAARTDADRWAALRAAEVAPWCADSGLPRQHAVSWSSQPARPALSVTVRCGR